MIEIAREYATKMLQGKRGVRPSAPKRTRVVTMKKVTEKDSKEGPSAPSVAKEKKNYPQSNAYKQTNTVHSFRARVDCTKWGTLRLTSQVHLSHLIDQ